MNSGPDATPAPQPEPVLHTPQGQPFSARYGDVYASRAGAAGQARAVFLHGCGLLDEPATWSDRRQFVVLETGFGLGTNFLATWQAWRADARRPQRLHYVALELHPVRAEDLLRECADEGLAALARELARQWPPAMRGVHALSLDGGRVRLQLVLGDAGDMLPRLDLGVDAVFLDGFAPSKNPRMWSRELLLDIARVCRPGARVASYTVARAVCDALRDAGFDVHKAPGYGGKARCLRAELRASAPGGRARAARPQPPGSALVVGAGLAGAACAHALASRGWQVRVLDARGAAAGASALPAGLAHLRPAHADDRLARLTRGALGWLRAAARDVFGEEGVLMSAELPRRAPLDEHARQWPAAWLRELDSEQSARCAGTTTAPRAWWTAGAPVAAAALCRDWLAHPGITVHAPRAVHALRHDAATAAWQALDAAGRVLDQADVCVLACALDTARVLHASNLQGARGVPRLRAQVGQGFIVPADTLPGLRALRGGVMARSYALALPPAAVDACGLDPARGWLFVGATYEHPEQPALSERQAWEHIGAGLRDWYASGGGVPGWPEVPPTEARGFRAQRAVAADRLALIGRWPVAEAAADQGLYVSAAMGSRGLLLSALGAECIAALLEGEPAPLERDLLDALDPLREGLRRD